MLMPALLISRKDLSNCAEIHITGIRRLCHLCVLHSATLRTFAMVISLHHRAARLQNLSLSLTGTLYPLDMNSSFPLCPYAFVCTRVLSGSSNVDSSSHCDWLILLSAHDIFTAHPCCSTMAAFFLSATPSCMCHIFSSSSTTRCLVLSSF